MGTHIDYASDDAFGLAKQLILDPAGPALSQLQRALGIVHASQVDAADLYFQVSRD